jgi:hypothetical protein
LATHRHGHTQEKYHLSRSDSLDSYFALYIINSQSDFFKTGNLSNSGYSAAKG